MNIVLGNLVVDTKVVLRGVHAGREDRRVAKEGARQ